MAINFVQADTAPQLRLVLTDSLTLEPINLTGATINFNVRAKGSSVSAFTRPATILNSSDATSGIAYVVWETGDLDRAPGNYEAEVEIITAEGLRETIYDFIDLYIREDIA